ncbi:DEKNAAC101974 [Brettanomyces naardenensis]|uniref:tRNA(Ile)-lysidine synthetase n=1 Tax=Brettanomyces naardenensis TaxID=13370 RepID=A0A448YJF9_BRENA|nr:DEKNAAC101974 [Brettanomyces naardenensis]
MFINPLGLTNSATATVSSKFLTSLTKIFAANLRNFPPRIAVALSGGADSVALLNLLVKIKMKKLNDLKIDAITVNHNIRPESTDEVNQLSKLISHLPIEHHVLEIKQKIDPRQMERTARELRYQLMLGACEKLGDGNLFMGHHRDDQLETFLMRMQSNSTLFGLRSMTPVSNFPMVSPTLNLKVVRPLLDIDKSELLNYCKENELVWFEDSTNFMPELTKRNYYRYLLKDEKNKLPPMLHKAKLLDSLSKVEHFNSRIERQIAGMDKSLTARGFVEFDPKTISLKLTVPRDLFSRYSFLTLDRYLFLKTYQVSPNKNFFHDFTKIDSKYAGFFESSSDKKKSSLMQDIFTGHKPNRFTVLNCQFEVSRDDENFKINICRANENARQGYNVLPFEMQEGFTDWLYFDNRIFLRILNKKAANAGKYRLEVYKDSEHLDLLKQGFPNYMDFKRLLNNFNLPVLIKEGKEHDEIVCFPTIDEFSTNFDKDDFSYDIELKKELVEEDEYV